MSQPRFISVLLAAVVALFSIAAQPTRSVDVTASTGAFAPTSIQVHVHEATRLHLTSTAGVHGLESTELGIPMTLIRPGEFADVTIDADKPGTYTLHCANFCGAGHAEMTLTVNVVE